MLPIINRTKNTGFFVKLYDVYSWYSVYYLLYLGMHELIELSGNYSEITSVSITDKDIIIKFKSGYFTGLTYLELEW